MDRWRDKWALVTGASAGIGRELARELAAGGANLVLTARRRMRLEELAEDLRRARGSRVEILTCDLARPEAPDEVFRFCNALGLEIELLVNNAGFGAYGEFPQVPLERQLEMIQLNVNAVVSLTHFFLRPMMQRGHGDVLIVSSTAGFQGVPYLATYAATKSFELHWAEALAEEMRPYGVRVCALCPGSTATEFQEIAGSPKHALQRREAADKVARLGLRALAHGKRYVISGAANWLTVQGQRIVPRSTVAKLAARMFRGAKRP